MIDQRAAALTTAERVIVLWLPDWPVHALRNALAQSQQKQNPTAQPPLALVAGRRVVACCATARAAGVRAGMRERDAQALSPTLEFHPHDPDRDARAFAPVVSALDNVVAGVEIRRPGLAALRSRGPARYYGGEEPAAHAILDCVGGLGFTAARIGIADGLFAAEQAARSAHTVKAITTVTAGDSRGFLAPLPVARATDPQLATTLQGLGIHTLGALAALPEDAVRQRFGPSGVAAHRRAMAAGPQHGSDIRPRTPPRDLAVEAEFEVALNTGAQLTEAAHATIAGFFTDLAHASLMCTGVRIELTDDTGARHERTWSHPSRFTEEDVLDRVRWQAESGTLSGASGGDERSGAGVIKIQITPTHTNRSLEAGLWGAEPDDRIRHHLRGIQLKRGRDSVGTVSLCGGRLAALRQQFSAWGSAPAHATSTAAQPWPGAAPAPSIVLPRPLPAALVDDTGESVRVDADDLLCAAPAALSVYSPPAESGSAGKALEHSLGKLPRSAAVTGWSAPWPLHERWWVGAPPRVRLQATLETGEAWLLILDTGRWFAEGRYD